MTAGPAEAEPVRARRVITVLAATRAGHLDMPIRRVLRPPGLARDLLSTYVTGSESSVQTDQWRYRLTSSSHGACRPSQGNSDPTCDLEEDLGRAQPYPKAENLSVIGLC